jgi:hydrogenase maturation protein HypF
VSAAAREASANGRARRALTVRGTVQGVGFRPFVHGLAARLGLAGFVLNAGGDVEIEVEGSEEALARFVVAVRRDAPPLARILAVEARPLAPRGESCFKILASEGAGESVGGRRVPPDAATCADCLRELFDPADRRHRYPFVNCTACGPRFTIIDDLPYDRARTSMAAFPLCPECRREYEDPADRRFHAEPVACPACGPRLRFEDLALEEGVAADCARSPLSGDAALRAAEQVVAAGGILALKGLGGYQLACDARREDAVARLRSRKRRFGKPFALMVADLEMARAIARVSTIEAATLSGAERPIVLLHRRATPTVLVAPSVAPDLLTLGVMLPTTPLHHLLLRDLGRPLVMTSGNRSEEPIAADDADARATLAGIADAILLHDRAIRARYDDSVVRVMSGVPVPIRRARGLAPAPLSLGFEAKREILALGAHQKAAVCFLRGREAYLGAHVGDLENAETLEALRAAIALWRRLFRLAPRALAHDLHPDYLSSAEARRLAREDGLPAFAVQHHHAHLAACLAEHGREGPAVGVIFDGTGLGTDGSVWGGEVLLGDAAGFERRGHIRAVRLPGAERAIRRPDRMALSHLLAAAPSRGDLHGFAARALAPEEALIVRKQVAGGFNAPFTSSAGRLFDAAATLLGAGPSARYEGELAAVLEGWADQAEGRGSLAAPLPAEVTGDGTSERPAVLEAGPLLVALAERAVAREDPSALARAFHDALAAMAVEAARRVALASDVATVALSGGCFQSRRLTEAVAAGLAREGLEPLVHRRAPPNDGGLALGQAVVAHARLERGEQGGG